MAIIYNTGQKWPHKSLIPVLHTVGEGEGIVICEDKHLVHCGTQIHIKMPQCQNKSKALLLNSRVISLVLVKLLGEIRFVILTAAFEINTCPLVRDNQNNHQTSRSEGGSCPMDKKEAIPHKLFFLGKGTNRTN